MICEECGSLAFVDDVRGEVACTGCGLVLEQIFDARPIPVYEGQSLSAETVSLTSTGIPSTRLSNEKYDGRGSVINQTTREKMKRLSWVDKHSARRKDRSVKRLYNMAAVACQKLELPMQLRDRAFYLTKKAYEKGALHNQEFALLVGSTLMLAAQEAGRHIPAKDLLAALSVGHKNPERQLHRSYRVVKRSLAMHEVRGTPEIMLGKLNVSPAVLSEAKRILAAMPERLKPEVDASVAIFVAAKRVGEPILQIQVANMCGTTDVSLRMRLKKTFPQYLAPPKLQIPRTPRKKR